MPVIHYFDYYSFVKVKVLVAQLCLTLCSTMDCSFPGSSVHEILQVRILQWVPFPSAREKVVPSPGDLPDLGIEPGSPALQADFYGLSHRSFVVYFKSKSVSPPTSFFSKLFWLF